MKNLKSFISTFLFSVFFTISAANAQTSGAGYISSIEALANKIEQNDIKVGELNKQHLETYSLESIKLNKLKKELNDLIVEKEAVLDEYRRGQFCTGCNVPRSQFRPGESFPHPGQSVRAATPQEIAAKAKEYDDKILRKGEELKLFEFSENEFTRKRNDIDKQMSNLKNQSDKYREEIVRLSKLYKETVVKDANSVQSTFINELIRIVADKHYIEDRVNIINTKISDLNKDEEKMVEQTKDKVNKQVEEEKSNLSNKIDANKTRLQQVLNAHKSRLEPLKTLEENLNQKLIELKAKLKNRSKLTADELTNIETLIADTEEKLVQNNQSVQSYSNDYASAKQQIESENKGYADKIWDLTVNLSKKQQEAIDAVRKSFGIRRKILEDAKAARTISLEQKGSLLLSKKAANRKKFMEYAEDADKERVRLINACQKAGCSCFGIDTHGIIVGNWNKAEGCVGEMESAHHSADPIYGCIEETAIYRQHYSSQLNGLSDSDLEALQRQSGKTRYDLILRKITN